MRHLDDNGILTDTQHGFCKHRSCESQLISTVHDLAKGIEDRKQTDVVLLDFSKAFDKSHISSFSRSSITTVSEVPHGDGSPNSYRAGIRRYC